MRTSNKEDVSYWVGSFAKITNDGSLELPSDLKNEKVIYGIITAKDFRDDEFLVTLVVKETGDTYSGWYVPCKLVERIASISEIIDTFTDNSYNYFN